LQGEGRWGAETKDARDWAVYNEELVVRGEFLLDLEWVGNWGAELEGMNKGKAGAPYLFPESLILMQAVWAQWLDYRGVEGVTRRLEGLNLIPKGNDYTTIWRRVTKANPSITLPPQKEISVACDGSGFKMDNRGEYRHSKYSPKKIRKFVRVVITADPEKKKLLAVSAEIDEEGVSESKISIRHISGILAHGKIVNKAYGDGAFDTRAFFNFLHEHDIESAVKIRRSATTKSRGSMRRAREVRAYQNEGYAEWARKRHYGLRWPGTEGVFSAVKRKFGERTRSKKRVTLCLEAMRRFWAYDVLSTYAKDRTAPPALF